MPRQRQSKNQLVKQLIPLFKAYGYDGVSMSMLAKEVGLSKASLYHHFPDGKEAMARHVLALSGADMQQLILNPLNDAAVLPVDKIKSSMEGVLTYYAGEAPQCMMNSMLIGSGYDLFKDGVEKAMSGWANLLSSVLKDGGLAKAEAESYAGDAIITIQGALIVNRLKGGRDYLEAQVSQLSEDLQSFVA